MVSFEHYFMILCEFSISQNLCLNWNKCFDLDAFWINKWWAIYFLPTLGLRLTLLLIPILFSTANFLIIMGVRFSPTGSVFFLRSPTTELIYPNSTLEPQRPFTSSCAAFPAFRSSFELGLNFGFAFSFCLLMALTYSPTRTALAGLLFSFLNGTQNIIVTFFSFSEANYKDNPSVSLAHESDEDVLYG